MLLRKIFTISNIQPIKTSHQRMVSLQVNKSPLKKRDDQETVGSFQINWKVLKRSWKNLRATAQKINPFQPIAEAPVFARLLKEDEVMYCFREVEDLSHWYVNTDEDIQGYSWAELLPSKNEKTANFRGRISNKMPRHLLPSSDPLENRQLFRGFAYFETKPFQTVLDKVETMNLSDFNAIKLRIRGDGRRYMFGSICERGLTVQHYYWAPLYTNGGPDWQEITIPYSKMYATLNGQKLKNQVPLLTKKMLNFQFMLRDGIEGPFSLEVDYIALTRVHGVSANQTDYHNPWKLTNSLSG